MKILSLLSVFLALPAMAQTAKVVILPKDISDEARSAYAQRAEADKRIAAVEAKVLLLVPDSDRRTEWLLGVVFSEDFRAAVPNPFMPQQGVIGQPWIWNNAGCSNNVIGVTTGTLNSLGFGASWR